jgi:uncharacterized protein (TIGR03435 family)
VGKRAEGMRGGAKESFFKFAAAVTLAGMLSVNGIAAPLISQSGAGQAPGSSTPMTQAPASQTPATSAAQTAPPAAPATAPTPQATSAPASAAQTPADLAPADDWMAAAGGKQAFDVASVKLNKSGMPPSGDAPHSNVALGPGAMYAPNGGLFNATNMPLFVYIVFAYKLNSNQMAPLMGQLPKWVTTSSYDIQARVDGSPTKDQMRMMMQSLLADRFKLAIHAESKQLSVYNLVQVKPGKFGPQIQPHPADATCSNAPPAPPAPGSAPTPPAPTTVAGGYPVTCGGLAIIPSTIPGRIRVGARNVPMALIATSFTSPYLGVDRPVVDQTGLTGTYDFVEEFSPQIDTPLPPGANFTPDPTGPTFQEAMKEQLGLKLDPGTGSVESYVIDHIEQPTEN